MIMIVKDQDWLKSKKLDICRSNQHNPPSHICIKDEPYHHVCPNCGNVSIIYPSKVSF